MPLLARWCLVPTPLPLASPTTSSRQMHQSLELIGVSGNPEHTPLCAKRLEMPILPRCDIQQGVTEGFTIGAWGHQSPPEHPPTSPGVTRGPPEPTSPGVTRAYRDPPHQGSPKPIGAHQSSRAHTVGAGPASALNCNGTCHGGMTGAGQLEAANSRRVIARLRARFGLRLDNGEAVNMALDEGWLVEGALSTSAPEHQCSGEISAHQCSAPQCISAPEHQCTSASAS